MPLHQKLSPLPLSQVVTMLTRLFGPFRWTGSTVGDVCRLVYANGFVEIRVNRDQQLLSIATGFRTYGVLTHTVVENIVDIRGNRRRRSAKLICHAPSGLETTIFIGPNVSRRDGLVEIQVNRFEVPELKESIRKRARSH